MKRGENSADAGLFSFGFVLFAFYFYFMYKV